jgi:hypothetical protein
MKILIILSIISISLIGIGCVEQTTYKSPSSTYETPNQQVISGINKITSVAGEKIVVSGINNEVTILNSDVSIIILSGENNIIYYPKDARPEIIESGINNEIHVY